MQIDLNLESAAVLLRCLAYGENAVSMEEHKQGTAHVIAENVALIRRQVCSVVSKEIINRAAGAK